MEICMHYAVPFQLFTKIRVLIHLKIWQKFFNGEVQCNWIEIFNKNKYSFCYFGLNQLFNRPSQLLLNYRTDVEHTGKQKKTVSLIPVRTAHP